MTSRSPLAKILSFVCNLNSTCVLQPENVVHFDHWVVVDLDNACKEGESIHGGTARYSAPEILLDLKTKSHAVASQSSDCFALGLLCYFVATGHDLFRDDETAIRELTSPRGFILDESLLTGVEKPGLKSAIKVRVTLIPIHVAVISYVASVLVISTCWRLTHASGSK